MNNPVPVPNWVSAFVTTTFAVPAEPAGVTQVIEVAEATATDAQAEPPMVTVAPARNPVPVTVIEVPPAAGPEVGETEATVGAATYVYRPVPVPD